MGRDKKEGMRRNSQQCDCFVSLHIQDALHSGGVADLGSALLRSDVVRALVDIDTVNKNKNQLIIK